MVDLMRAIEEDVGQIDSLVDSFTLSQSEAMFELATRLAHRASCMAAGFGEPQEVVLALQDVCNSMTEIGVLWSTKKSS